MKNLRQNAPILIVVLLVVVSLIIGVIALRLLSSNEGAGVIKETAVVQPTEVGLATGTPNTVAASAILPTSTATSTATAAATLTPSSTATPTATATATLTPTPTFTVTPTATPIPLVGLKLFSWLVSEEGGWPFIYLGLDSDQFQLWKSESSLALVSPLGGVRQGEKFRVDASKILSIENRQRDEYSLLDWRKEANLNLADNSFLCPYSPLASYQLQPCWKMTGGGYFKIKVVGQAVTKGGLFYIFYPHDDFSLPKNQSFLIYEAYVSF